MSNFSKTTLVLIFLLVASNIVWGIQYQAKKSQLSSAESELAQISQNKKILAFQKLFVDKVLKSNGSVDFNTRVELQNAVTDIHDADISRAWEAFLSAKTEQEGQNKVKDLLSFFASKVYAQ